MNHLPDFEIIIHAATSTNLKNYTAQPETEKDNLELGVTNFCKLISQSNMNSKIVYCSSGAVYGIKTLHLENIDNCKIIDRYVPKDDKLKNLLSSRV
jgi:hypothetical protein